MAAISTTSYVLDSRQKSPGSSVSVANYNLTALGSPIEAGTYELLSFNSRNNVYNVDDSNDEIYYIEDAGAELGPVLLPHGYYTSQANLAAAVKVTMEAGGAGTYTITFSALTNLFTIAVAGGATAVQLTWGANSTQPIANLLLGFTAVDTASAASVTSNRGADLDPHSNLLITITEDALKNVTLVDGTEFSLIIPLDSAYNEEINGLKAQTFNQTVQFVSQFNQLNVSLFTEDGVALPDINSPQYELIIRRVF